MRKLLVLFTILLVVPATAYSRAPKPTQDGTLSVREGRGMVQLSAKGSVTGRFDRGKIVVTDPNPYDANRPVVYGARRRPSTRDETSASASAAPSSISGSRGAESS